MRALALLLVPLLACAGAPVRPAGAPSRVVVLGASVMPRPAPRGLVSNVFGAEEPRDVVARLGAEALSARGFEVVDVEALAGAPPSLEEAAHQASRAHADATVVLVLTRLDLSALQPLGQAEVALEWRMVGPDGRVFADASRRATTTERLYRAQSDWRSHVRQAVIQAVGELP